MAAGSPWGLTRRIVEQARRAASAQAGGPRRSTLLVVIAVALLALSALPTILGSRGSSVSALDALPAGPAASPAASITPIGGGSGATSGSEAMLAGSLSSTDPARTNAPAGVGVAQLAAPAGFDPLDLATKTLLVGALLYLTLRALRHLQSGPGSSGNRLAVLESRTLGSKATLHLVGVGERRIIVGLTPAGMVALAELDATELPDVEPRQLASAAGSAGRRGPQTLIDGLRGFLP